jgi:hypothetical protein
MYVFRYKLLVLVVVILIIMVSSCMAGNGFVL